jgi:hypothetical protein
MTDDPLATGRRVIAREAEALGMLGRIGWDNPLPPRWS